MQEIEKILDKNGIKTTDYQIEKNKILLKVGVTGLLLYEMGKIVSDIKIVSTYTNSTYYRQGFRLMLLYSN